MSALASIGSFFVRLIWPARCAGCDVLLASEQPFCEPCAASVLPPQPACPGCAGPTQSAAGARPTESAGGGGRPQGCAELCGRCRAHPEPFSAAFAAALYGGVVADALLGFKHGGRRHLVRPLGQLLAPALAAALAGGADAVMPVPLHPRRLRRRGFNQALELLRLARAALGPSAASVPLLLDDLRRTRDTPPLGREPPPVRRSYVRGAFEVPRPQRLEGCRLLLVDDVMTTGATLAECARTLLRAGASSVTVLALARAWDS